jgi:formylglycine-generating enzyme required for sulfatase activity
MAGNVWEWCWDWYGAYGSFAQTNPRGSVSSSLRVIRGGSCHIGGEGCRLAHRDANASTLDDRYDRFGFRAVLAPGQ